MFGAVLKLVGRSAVKPENIQEAREAIEGAQQHASRLLELAQNSGVGRETLDAMVYHADCAQGILKAVLDYVL